MASPRLDVPVMDMDHARIEAMFAEVASTRDADLATLLERIAAEIAAHFAREEAVMRERRVPILPQHRALHARLVAEIDAMRGGADGSLRPFLETRLPQMIDEHVATADTMSAAFLTGRIAAPLGPAS